MLRVMVVDNNMETARAIKMALESERHCEVSIQNNKEDAFCEAITWDPHFIVCEGLGLDGVWLVEELDRLHATRHIPVLILSHNKPGFNEIQTRQFFHGIGAAGFLAKPLNPTDVGDMLAEMRRIQLTEM